MYPTLSEAIRGERLTVGPSFFNKWMLPIGLILLLLTGIGPLLAWRKSTLSNLVHQFLWPVTAALVTGGALVAAGVRVWASGICFALCAWVVVAIAQEMIRGAGVRKQSTGTDLFTAFVGLFGRSRRRYAGYIVHLGIVVMFFGFPGDSRRLDITLRRAGKAIGPLFGTTRALTPMRRADDHRPCHVIEDGKKSEGCRRGGLEKRLEEPTTEVGIRRSIGEDLYIVLGGFDVTAQSGTYKLTVNPLVNWVWLGVGIMVIGSIVSMLPESMFAVAMAKLPAGAATTALLIVLLLPGVGHAQTSTSELRATIPKSDSNATADEIICMCGLRSQRMARHLQLARRGAEEARWLPTASRARV